jgi:hypothetical protein
MGLLWSDVVDARMVVLRIVPSKVPFEIDDSLFVVEESTGIFRGSFYGAECGLYERIVIGSSGASTQLRHVMILTQPLDRLGFHLAPAVVDHFGSLVLWQVENVLLNQAAFKQESRLLSCLLPTDAPLDGFAGILV